jgi:hypothetical protein
MPHPGGFSWSDVEPALSAVIDVEAAVSLALAHVPPAPLPDRKTAQAIEDAIDVTFIRRFGTWAAGWRWAGGEGSIGGGPVRGWCCPPHSIWPKGDRERRRGQSTHYPFLTPPPRPALATPCSTTS